jgi:hypothetical protein
MDIVIFLFIKVKKNIRTIQIASAKMVEKLLYLIKFIQKINTLGTNDLYKLKIMRTIYHSTNLLLLYNDNYQMNRLFDQLPSFNDSDKNLLLFFLFSLKN